MDRTNIIDHDEVARAMTLASPDKGKGNGKKKATEARASRPPKSHKVNTVPTARVGAKATTTPTQTPETRFYEANGLKIPLYNKAGLGNTKRQYARLSKGLLKYSLDELLGIVEQYAGADKRQELTDKRLQKSSLANWIEAKETLALGPNPKSTLSIADNQEQEAESADDAASFLMPTISTSSGSKIKKRTKAASISDNEKGDSLIAPEDNSTQNSPSNRKRGVPDGSPDGQPHAKLQKLDALANLAVTSTGRSAKENALGMSVDGKIPTSSQTDKQTTAYKDTDSKLHRQNPCMYSAGMDPFDLDRSSTIIRGDGEDLVLTVTSGQGFRKGATYLHETTVPHGATESPVSTSSSIPYLKKGKHGRRGEFLNDPDLHTGLGHQIEPEDHLKWDEFRAFQGKLYQQFPHYPKPSQRISIDSEAKDAWDAWQTWYGEFTEKYLGYAVAHIWPCGCEKVSDENESEEE